MSGHDIGHFLPGNQYIVLSNDLLVSQKSKEGLQQRFHTESEVLSE